MDCELESASPVLRLKTKEGQIENDRVPWRGKGRVFSRESDLKKIIAQNPSINAFSPAWRTAEGSEWRPPACVHNRCRTP